MQEKLQWLCEKCPNTEFFLVRIFQYLDQKKLHARMIFRVVNISMFAVITCSSNHAN